MGASANAIPMAQIPFHPAAERFKIDDAQRAVKVLKAFGKRHRARLKGLRIRDLIEEDGRS